MWNRARITDISLRPKKASFILKFIDLFLLSVFRITWIALTLHLTCSIFHLVIIFVLFHLQCQVSFFIMGVYTPVYPMHKFHYTCFTPKMFTHFQYSKEVQSVQALDQPQPEIDKCKKWQYKMVNVIHSTKAVTIYFVITNLIKLDILYSSLAEFHNGLNSISWMTVWNYQDNVVVEPD